MEAALIDSTGRFTSPRIYFNILQALGEKKSSKMQIQQALEKTFKTVHFFHLAENEKCW